MSECPQGTCDNIKDLHSKTNKIELCGKGKASWKSLGIAILGLVGVITTITLYAMAAEKGQNDKISQIPVIQKDIEHIKGDLKDIKTSVDKMKEKAVTKDDIDRLIKAVKKDK